MLIERHEYDNGNHAVESTLYRNDGGVLSKTALTACSQTASRQTLDNAAALDVELFEVSAHVRARPEHEAWQGKIYTADELRTVCGLGEVDGLYGINCRHSYYPYIPGTKPLYSNGELDEMKDASVRYNGKEMTRYEAEQKLRGVERAVRKYKLQADVL
ncbi:MAG: minor capsid protein, partial [Treponema sp.]|nr:minor capsid protein [Treponema sp.]